MDYWALLYFKAMNTAIHHLHHPLMISNVPLQG